MLARLLVVPAALIASGALISPVQALPISPTAAPQITSVSPRMGGPGDAVELTGTGLSVGGEAPSVTFLDLYPAQVKSHSPSALTVVVPTIPDPPDGFIQIRVTTSSGSGIAPFRYYATPPGEVTSPTSLKARPTRGKVTLTWGPPTGGAGMVTAYEWRFQLQRGPWSAWKKVAKGADARQQTVLRMKRNKVYVFQVRAIAGSQRGPAATTQATGK